MATFERVGDLSPFSVPRHPRPARCFEESLEAYWICDGHVMWRHSRLKSAEPGSFEFYAGGFARDGNHCYILDARLRDAKREHFAALNFAYAADDRNVWTIGGKVKDAERQSFEVLDTGARFLAPGRPVPTGYAKDANCVYHYNFSGKPCVIRTADCQSFRAVNEEYGTDRTHVYYERKRLPKADVKSWELLLGNYSRDAARVYYQTVIVDGADPRTIVCEGGGTHIEVARDCRAFYSQDHRIDAAAYEREISAVQQFKRTSAANLS